MDVNGSYVGFSVLLKGSSVRELEEPGIDRLLNNWRSLNIPVSL